MTWTPRPRPEWVEELNAFGRQLGSPAALVNLDEESLLATSARNRPGSTTIGDDDASSWREGAARVVACAETKPPQLLGRSWRATTSCARS